MVHFCCVPGCANRSNRETGLSYFKLPLKRKSILKQWIHVIGRKNLPINNSTRVCSVHFINASARKLRPDEVPSEKLPLRSITVKTTSRKPPKHRPYVEKSPTNIVMELSPLDRCKDTQTEGPSMEELERLLSEEKQKNAKLTEELNSAEDKQTRLQFRLANIKNNDSLVCFYTGFSTFFALKYFYDFLGPAVNHLVYSQEGTRTDGEIKRCRPRALPPLEEFFMTMIRLRLGLLEQDLAHRFQVSQSTVSRIICTWINFLFLKLKEIPLWPPKGLVKMNMPADFREKYPSTRVIIDATEIYIEQPKLPELQQMTFSNYKNDNTFKGLVGISPDGSVTFISSLYPGSISDKELTKRSGILDLLEEGDSVMADRGFEIEEDLLLIGVKLNIPPFLRGKKQLSNNELVATRRIASLRIHVERAMERIKNFHIFDRIIPATLTDIADRIFFVCCVLTNFSEQLCK